MCIVLLFRLAVHTILKWNGISKLYKGIFIIFILINLLFYTYILCITIKMKNDVLTITKISECRDFSICYF